VPFEWKRFLEIARHLESVAGNSVDYEAALRSAVNRAYYAAFGHAMQHAVQNSGYSPSQSASDHSGLRRHYKMRNKIPISDSLSKLYGWREQCDYEHPTPANLERIASDAIKEADQIIKNLPLQIPE